MKTSKILKQHIKPAYELDYINEIHVQMTLDKNTELLRTLTYREVVDDYVMQIVLQAGYTSHCLNVILPMQKNTPLSELERQWINDAYQSNFRVIGSTMHMGVAWHDVLVATLEVSRELGNLLYPGASRHTHQYLNYETQAGVKNKKKQH